MNFFKKIFNLSPKYVDNDVTIGTLKSSINSSYIAILKSFYHKNNYENIPYILDEKSAKYVLENKDRFPVLVPKEYMTTIKYKSYNLILGDIIFLWWLTSRKNISNVPLYFGRTYGIDWKTSQKKLQKYGLLTQDNRLTESGTLFLHLHQNDIKNHRAKKEWQGIGPVHYNYSQLLKGKEKQKYMLDKLHQHLRVEIKFYKESKIDFFEWLPANDPCPVCFEIANKHTKYGKGVYKLSDYEKIESLLHYDCRCTTVPYIEGLPKI